MIIIIFKLIDRSFYSDLTNEDFLGFLFKMLQFWSFILKFYLKP